MKDRPTVYAVIDIDDCDTVVVFWEKGDAEEWVRRNRDDFKYEHYMIQPFEVQ